MTKVLVMQMRINQLIGVNRLHLCIIALPELQPAHSCGLPDSMQAGCALPLGPGDEPEKGAGMKD